MTWYLLTMPAIGLSLFIAVLLIGHWVMPLKYVELPKPESDSVDYNTLVQKTALILGKGIVGIMRDSLDKSTTAKAAAAEDKTAEAFPQFSKPTSMSFEGFLEVDLGNLGSAQEGTNGRGNVARRSIGPR